MSTDTTFYEGVYEKYWDNYLVECETTKTHPDTSNFLVWLDDNDLIPEVDDDN